MTVERPGAFKPTQRPGAFKPGAPRPGAPKPGAPKFYVAPVIDYAAFSTMLSPEDPENAQRRRERNVEDAIPALGNAWVGLLSERPYSIDELVEQIPKELQFVRPYLSGVDAVAVAQVFNSNSTGL